MIADSTFQDADIDDCKKGLNTNVKYYIASTEGMFMNKNMVYVKSFVIAIIASGIFSAYFFY